MNKPLKQLETRVTRTYKGGLLLDKFFSKEECLDSFMPEDWISSFIEAKNKDYVAGEGLTRVEYNGEKHPLHKGDKYFISALCSDLVLCGCHLLVCYPNKI